MTISRVFLTRPGESWHDINCYTATDLQRTQDRDSVRSRNKKYSFHKALGGCVYREESYIPKSL